MSKQIASLILLTLALAVGPVAAQAAGGTGQQKATGSKLKNPKASKKPNFKVSHYQDWEVRCPKSNKSKARCEMTQLINNPNNGKPIMRVVMGYPQQAKGAAMIFITPLGTRLAPGMKLNVDGGKNHNFPYQICLKQGCRADYPIRGKLKRKMKHGKNAHVQIVGPRGKKINLKVSLQGFTAANNKIRP